MPKLLWDSIENFETVIWDWNGTLLNDHEAAWKAECRLFEKIGRTHMDVSERKKVFTMPVESYYTKIGVDFSNMSYEQICKEWFAHYEEELKNVTLFEGTRDLLARVVSAGKQQFILSAAPEKHLEEYTEKNDLRKYFSGIYGLQSNIADCKRARGQDLFREHGLNPQTSLIIGDMVHDAEVAETLNCQVLLVADGHQAFEVLSAASTNVLQSRYS